MRPDVAGDAEQGSSAAAGRGTVDGSVHQGHGSAGSGRVSLAGHRHIPALVTLSLQDLIKSQRRFSRFSAN